MTTTQDALIVRTGDPSEPFSWDWEGPLSAFFSANDFDADEEREIRETLARGETYRDGGGAWAEWSVWAVRAE